MFGLIECDEMNLNDIRCDIRYNGTELGRLDFSLSNTFFSFFLINENGMK